MHRTPPRKGHSYVVELPFLSFREHRVDGGQGR